MTYQRPQLRRFGTIRDLTMQQAEGTPAYVAINPIMPVLYGVPTTS